MLLKNHKEEKVHSQYLLKKKILVEMGPRSSNPHCSRANCVFQSKGNYRQALKAGMPNGKIQMARVLHNSGKVYLAGAGETWHKL